MLIGNKACMNMHCKITEVCEYKDKNDRSHSSYKKDLLLN